MGVPGMGAWPGARHHGGGLGTGPGWGPAPAAAREQAAGLGMVNRINPRRSPCAGCSPLRLLSISASPCPAQLSSQRRLLPRFPVLLPVSGRMRSSGRKRHSPQRCCFWPAAPCASAASLTAPLCFPGTPGDFVGQTNTSTVLSPPSEPLRLLLPDAEKEAGLRIWSDADVADTSPGRRDSLLSPRRRPCFPIAHHNATCESGARIFPRVSPRQASLCAVLK